MLNRRIVLYVSSIICLCIDCSLSAQPSFRKDYVFSPETQNFYKLHRSRQQFVDAVNRCRMEGASLLVTETKLERDVVINLIDATYPKEEGRTWFPVHYIGLHDLFSEGEFIALDGRSIDNFFVDWDQDEPNNYNGENCIELRRTGKYNDLKCDAEQLFICEKPQKNVEWNALCDLPDLNYLYNKELGKCYKLHLEPKDWSTAYATCSAEQSYLAVINNQAEADYLVKIVSEADKTGIRAPQFVDNEVYLGFHNQFLSGFTTIKGQPLEEAGYTRWAPGQPDNAGDERCGSMFFDGSLNDLACSRNAIFICEHELK